jgi:dGTPase
MSTIREEREALEKRMLADWATSSEKSKGRENNEPQCNVRTCFQRDIDRITHSKAFRRLKHKTQVFLQPEGDHYRTRLTHTLEVARIGRTIARALNLNEDLTEAIALGHDLGHTPFGHAGERALNVILSEQGGFRHNEQSLRVVEFLERDGAGLNLTYEVRDGILCHTGDKQPDTPEGSVVRIADRIAYLNHDVDDAIRAGILRESDIPPEIICAFGGKHSDRINALICDVISESAENKKVMLSSSASLAFSAFYEFMFKNVYLNMKAKREETKVFGLLNRIFEYYVKNPDMLPNDYRTNMRKDGIRQAVCYYVAGMTDKYAVSVYNELFIPEAWKVV